MTDLRLLTPGDVPDLFHAYGLDEPQHEPTREQSRLITELLGMYARRGLLPGGAPAPLCEVCPRRVACWGHAARQTRRAHRVDDQDHENGGIVMPWIGPQYERGGACVLAINFNIADEHVTNLMSGFDLVFREYLRSLRNGQTRLGRSAVPYAIARAAGGLIDVLDRGPVTDRAPTDAAEVWPRIAQLQAIKCIPLQTGSSPHRAMWAQCPHLLLAEELAVLAPSMLLVLGTDALNALAELEGWIRREPDTPDNPVGTFRGDGWDATVYGVAHPAARGTQSEDEITSLLAELADAHPPTDPSPQS